MAYTSDLRVKNIIKDLHGEILDILDKKGLKDKLFLRVFDESKEDSWPWEEGGLSFKDPLTGDLLGSNDAAWYTEGNKPLVVVEGTFGTERGQFGDGQLNRVSHSLSVALNGYLGVTLVPFKGQSFVKKGQNKDVLNPINYQNGNLHKGMAAVSLNYSLNNEGKFLIIDAYDRSRLVSLVVEAALKEHGLPNKLGEQIDSILQTVKSYLGSSQYGAQSNQVITNLINESGQEIDCKARFYTQNIEALTTSSKRDGHGLLGKNLVEIYSTAKDVYSIFIRLRFEDIELLKKRKSKEFSHLLNNKRVNILCFDDLLIDDDLLKTRMEGFIKQNLHQTRENDLMKEIQAAFNNGNIRVKIK